MFFIEGMGFPRALGVLDTNSTTQYKYLQLLDPSKLDNKKISDLGIEVQTLCEFSGH